MNYTVRKGLGSILGNLTRQMLLTQWPSVRPIGYAVGDKSTVISAGSNVVEDMVEFSSSISSLLNRLSYLASRVESTVGMNLF